MQSRRKQLKTLFVRIKLMMMMMMMIWATIGLHTGLTEGIGEASGEEGLRGLAQQAPDHRQYFALILFKLYGIW